MPFLTYRRTTAHDLGRILFELHGAAVGNRLSLRRTGLTRHEARVALGLLLSTDPRGDNAGPLPPSTVPGAVPMAQKHGWTTSILRHSAAIVYGRHGPVIVVLLTYGSKLHREGLTKAWLADRTTDPFGSRRRPIRVVNVSKRPRTRVESTLTGVSGQGANWIADPLHTIDSRAWV